MPDSDRLVVPSGVRDAVVTCALGESPRECCGLLIGDVGRVHAVWPARNVAEPPVTRYRIDPVDHFSALRHARARGLDVVGAYHSHPRTPASPSERDRGEALPGFVYVIVGPVSEEHEPPQQAARRARDDVPVTAWSFVDGNFVEIGLVLE